MAAKVNDPALSSSPIITYYSSQPAPSEEESGFAWTPLQDTKQEFRLLALHPGTPGSPVICKLIHAKISSVENQYEALSYAWGDTRREQAITCDGKKLLVSSNLLIALQKFRYTHGAPRRLWIDAVCIDQGNVSERNHQVQQMGIIYSAAKTCLVWLGPSAGFDPFQALREWTAAIDTQAEDKTELWTKFMSNREREKRTRGMGDLREYLRERRRRVGFTQVEKGRQWVARQKADLANIEKMAASQHRIDAERRIQKNRRAEEVTKRPNQPSANTEGLTQGIRYTSILHPLPPTSGPSPSFASNKNEQHVISPAPSDLRSLYGPDYDEGSGEEFPPVLKGHVEANWDQLDFLFTRPWFFRRWIIQEAVLSKQVRLICGDHISPLVLFQNLHNALVLGEMDLFDRKRLRISEEAQNGLFNAFFIVSCKCQNPSVGLGNILRQARLFQCSEPRDAVFALLNLLSSTVYETEMKNLTIANSMIEDAMTSQKAITALMPDYNLSFEQVQVATTRWLLEAGHTRVLSTVSGRSVGCRKSKPEMHQLPSWVPESFQVDPERPDLDHSFDVLAPLTRKHPTRKTLSYHLDEENVLTLRGSCLDRIEAFGPPRMPQDLSDSAWKLWINHSLLLIESQSRSGRLIAGKRFKVGAGVCDLYSEDMMNPFKLRRKLLQRKNINIELSDVFGEIQAHHPVFLILLDDFEGSEAMTSGRRLCATENGHLGLIPPTARQGDLVYLFEGIDVPMLVRPCGCGHFNLIGEALVDELAGSLSSHELKIC